MKTNRDFYRSLAALIAQQGDRQDLSLEEYLLSLRARATLLNHRPALSLDEFFNLLSGAFSAPNNDSNVQINSATNAPGFTDWLSLLDRQIKDLEKMKKNGQLDNKHREFGIQVSAANTWYNFTPCSYLECATQGALGGWNEGDETGRQYVPGQVAVSTPDGKIASCDPRELDRSPEEIAQITWTLFTDFIYCGQSYE